jgi:hypothetical protein
MTEEHGRRALPATPEYQRALADACMRHGVPFEWQGPGALLIAGWGITAVLSDVMEHGFEVLGLEGFERPDPTVRPRLDLIFDRDRGGFGRDPMTAAQAFGEDVWIDVTLRRIR